MESVLKASTSDNLDNKLWSQNGNNAKEGPVDNHVDDTDNQNTIEGRANNNSPVHYPSESQSSNACDTSLVDNACQSQQQLQVNQEPKSDDSCLFHPEQEKCKPDQITGKCPPGFSMNEKTSIVFLINRVHSDLKNTIMTKLVLVIQSSNKQNPSPLKNK